MTRSYDILLEWDPDAQMWVTYVPELGDISTFAATREAAIEATREMILGYLEALEVNPSVVPRPVEHLRIEIMAP